MKTSFAHLFMCVCVSGREKEIGRVRGKHVNEGVTHYSTNNANY